MKQRPTIFLHSERKTQKHMMIMLADGANSLNINQSIFLYKYKSFNTLVFYFNIFFFPLYIYRTKNSKQSMVQAST